MPFTPEEERQIQVLRAAMKPASVAEEMDAAAGDAEHGDALARASAGRVIDRMDRRDDEAGEVLFGDEEALEPMPRELEDLDLEIVEVEAQVGEAEPLERSRLQGRLGSLRQARAIAGVAELMQQQEEARVDQEQERVARQVDAAEGLDVDAGLHLEDEPEFGNATL